MSQVGIPLFYLQELAAARIRFKDLFNDDSLFWGWRTDNLDAERIATEENGVLKIGCSDVGNYSWDTIQNECPKIIITQHSFPCEITIKIKISTLGGNTQGGLLYSKSPSSFGNQAWIGIVRRRIADPAFNGIAVVCSNENVLWSLEDITMPVWFRIRISALATYSIIMKFYYSYDGVTFIYATEETSGQFNSTIGAMVLAVMNCVGGGVQGSGTIDFDSFEMTPKTVN